MRPLARSRCLSATIAGRNVWALLSYSTSPTPSSSVASSSTTYSGASVPTTWSTASGVGSTSWRAKTASATTVVSTKRSPLAPTIRRRRSWRSVITPAGSVNKSHGSRWATATRAMSSGLRVIADASQG
jgi:hypothetical protein